MTVLTGMLYWLLSFLSTTRMMTIFVSELLWTWAVTVVYQWLCIKRFYRLTVEYIHVE